MTAPDNAALVRRMDRRAQTDPLAMLQLSVSVFEDRFSMRSYMAHSLMRGTPLSEAEFNRFEHIEPGRSYSDYLEGRRRGVERLNASRADVREWLDQYETLLELGADQAQQTLRIEEGIRQRRAATEEAAAASEAEEVAG